MTVVVGVCIAILQNCSSHKDMEEQTKLLVAKIEKVQPEDASDELKAEVRTAEERIADPKTYDDFFLKAYAAQMDENYDKAMEYYRKVIELAPESAMAYNNMGIVYDLGKQDYVKAIECYEKAIDLAPDDAETYYDAYYNMGVAYNLKQDYDKAIECSETAIKLKPDSAGAYCLMGVAYNGKQDYDKAIECSETAVKLKPDYELAYASMGFAYSRKGIKKKAIECMKKAAQLGFEPAQKWLAESDKTE